MGNTKTYRQIEHELSTEDVCPVLNLITTANKNLNGRPSKYPDNEQGLEAFRQNCVAYFEYLEEANKNLDEKHAQIADVEGLCVYLGISRNVLNLYAKRSPAWSGMIEHYKNQIAYMKKQLALHGKITPVLAIFDFCNNHNYVNTSNFQIEEKRTVENISDDLNAELISKGLIWDESKEEFVYGEQ